MASKPVDRVRDTTTTTGTGTITLSGTSPTGYVTFASTLVNGDVVYYVIESLDLTQWEVGKGTYTSSGTTLSRTTVLASSNSGSLVSFSAGTKNVWIDAPAILVAPTVLFTLTSVFTSNSASSASIIGSISLGANFFTVGKTVRIKARGYYNTGASPSTILPIVRLSSGIVAQMNNGTGLAPPANLSNKMWEIEVDVTCVTTGATGTVMATGTIRLNMLATVSFGANTSNVLICSTATPAAVTIDTTANLTLDMQLTNGGTGTTFVADNATVEVLDVR